MTPPEPLARIAYLTGEYPRASDTFIQREVAALRAQGLSVLTTSIRRTGAEHHVGPEQKAEAAATFHVLDAARDPLHLLRCHLAALRAAPRRYGRAFALAMRTAPAGLRGLLFQLFYFAEAAVLVQKLRAERVQHLHNHIAKSSCSVAMIASEMSGIPYSFTLHGPDIFFAPEHWRLDEKIARARFVACISHFCRAQAMAFSDARHWAKLHIVHCGVAPDRYVNQTDAEGDSAPELLFVGRLAAVKGLPVLFEALEHLAPRYPDLHLKIIGDGPDAAALKRQAQALPLHVSFLGYQGQSEVTAALHRCTALVLPSFAEGLPVVLIEAMAAARPVVATRIAGIPELIVDGDSGLLVPPGDAEALAGALDRVLADSSVRKRMGAAGRAQVSAEFDVAKEARWLGALMHGYHAGTPLTALRPASSEAAKPA